MKRIIKRLINKRFNVSFSKAGDDIQLYKLINNPKPGVYVDVGCWHPTKASNTYYFYLRNWKGICIDPNPELVTLFNDLRPKDNLITSAISDIDGVSKYYKLSEPYSSMNTMDYEFIKNNGIVNQIKAKIVVPTIRLDNVLNQNLNKLDRLDFFDIDVEGLDLKVLKTNDWEVYRPQYIMVESDMNIKLDIDSDITKYLESVNYFLIGKSIMNNNLGNVFYMDKKLM